ncbi:hypothetical protein [Candidatus Frankia nodulisporulans]|uniref:hypothetical protein n=1 Tax=Candidatus Frankia nodulisporulans TaxID=2060052 RepID=UPI001FD18E9C|nr:hypothetical protein [Candidatus Frankia nodulisporulans]
MVTFAATAAGPTNSTRGCRPVARATVVGCYHPGRQNTFTGRVTEVMLDTVFASTPRLVEPS